MNDEPADGRLLVAPGRGPAHVGAPGHRPDRRGPAQAAGIYLLARLMSLVAFAVATKVPPRQTFREVLGAWDAGFYVDIATTWYPPSLEGDAATVHGYFPLYPLLIRAVEALTPMSRLLSALVLNLVLGCAFAALLWKLVCRFAPARQATRAVALVAFFPWSFVLTMTYAEPLLLLCAVICLTALLDHRWIVAGLAAAAAGAARPNGAVLTACCLWAAVAAVRHRRDWSTLVAPLLAPLGLLAFFAYQGVITGDPLANIHLKDAAVGEQGILLAPATADDRLIGYFSNPLVDYNMTGTYLSVILIIFGAYALASWKPPAEITIWCAGVVALAASITTYGSMPRFVLTAFPLVAALGARVKDATFAVLLGISASLMGTLALLATITLDITP